MTNALTLDATVLRDTGVRLRHIAIALDDADARSSRAAGAAGHDGLSTCLVDFAAGWDSKRAAIVEDIARLSDACAAVASTFEETDASLGSALRGEA